MNLKTTYDSYSFLYLNYLLINLSIRFILGCTEGPSKKERNRNVLGFQAGQVANDRIS